MRAPEPLAAPEDFESPAGFAATAVGAAAGVAAVAAGVPVEAAVGLDEPAEDVTSATVAGTFSFLPQPDARNAAKIARGRSRIFMTQTTLRPLFRTQTRSVAS